MTMLTLVHSTSRAQTKGDGLFSALALVLSFTLAVLGVFSAEPPRPGPATGDPFLFVMRP